MGENTKIGWTDHTFNPWWGCTKISPGCANCYADNDATRYGFDIWGDDKPRRFFGDEHFREPLNWERRRFRCTSCGKWNESTLCRSKGCSGTCIEKRPRIFMASYADFWESRPDLLEHQLHALDVVRQTPLCDYLILTKRPENIMGRLAAMSQEGEKMGRPEAAQLAREWFFGKAPRNVWLGVTAENQKEADRRVDILMAMPARVRFVSYEPALEAVSFKRWCGPVSETDEDGWRPDPGLDWIIVGGESGNKARGFDMGWARSIVELGARTQTAVFVKQMGAKPAMQAGSQLIPITDLGRKGDNMRDWPHELRVQQHPVPV